MDRADAASAYERDGFALLAVEDRATGEFLGNVGPILQHVDGVDEVELGWSITPARARQGIATEAAFACRDWVFATLPIDHVISLILPANDAVARRGREPGDDGVEAGAVGDAEAADPPGVPVGPSRGLMPSELEQLAQACRDRYADRAVTVGLEVDAVERA